MKLTSGLFTDTLPRNQPTGSWRDARNVVTQFPGSLSSEPGFTQLSLSYGLLPIGGIELGDGRTVVFSLSDPTNLIPEIGMLSRDAYVTLVKDPVLNFSLDYPVKGEYELTIRGEEIITWTDNYNPPRVLNLTKPGFSLNPDKSLTDPTSFATSQTFAPYRIPTIELLDVVAGGQLLSGTYSYAVSYEDNSGFVTSWSPASRYVQINDEAVTGDYTQVDGCLPGTLTNKSIRLVLNNLDTRYVYLRVVAIRRVGQVVTTTQFLRTKLTGSTQQLTHSGGETGIVLIPSEVLTPPVIYNRARSIAQLNGELFYGGVTTTPPVAYQRYANGIQVRYITKSLDLKSGLNSYKNPKNTFYFRGFLHDEVYALYLVFRLLDGTLSEAYHIPGRAAARLPQTWNVSGADERTLLSGLLGAPAYLNEDNALGNDVRFYQTRDTSDNPNASTNMGYWENANELYADEDESDVVNSAGVLINSLRNQPVRHHKFPALYQHNHYASGASGNVQVLGIQLDNVIIPDEIAQLVSGYEVFYARRGYDNARIVGQSLLTFGSSVMQLGENSEAVTTPGVGTTGGNWNYYFDEDATPDKWMILKSDYVRLNPVDVLINQANVAPTHITNQVLLGKTAKIRRAQEDIRHKSLLIEVNHLDDGPDYGATGTYPVDEGSHLRRISDVQLLATNSNPSGIYDNTGGEQALVARITSGESSDFMGMNSQYANASPIGFVNDYVRRDSEEEDNEDKDTKFFADNPAYQSSPGGPQYGGRWVHNYLTNLNVYRTDVYAPYRNQELVATGFVTPISATTSIDTFGGDTFFGNYGERRTGPNAVTVLPVNEYGLNPDDGIKVLYHYLVESVANIGFRHIDNTTLTTGDATTYFPKVGATYLDDWLDAPLTRSLLIGYNNDYTVTNDLPKSYPFVPNQFIGNFPTRILRSRKSLTEALVSSWKHFPANDYYEMPRHRGIITNLASLGNRLLIHTERSLFRTLDKTNLTTSEALITIGSGDIFQFPPEEVLYGKSGYAGTVFSNACLVTKLGYFFPSQSGKVFLLTEALQEISNKGMSLYFRNELLYKTGDNPYNTNGLKSVFDETYNRILLTYEDIGRTWTLSYSGELNAWASRHDYIPAFLTASGDRLLSIFDGKVYEHHTGTPGEFYQAEVGTTRGVTSIDVVINPAPEQAKLFYAVSWNSEVRDEFDDLHYDDTFDRILFFTNRQTSGYQDVRHLSQGRTLEDTFYYNDLRDGIIDPRNGITNNVLLGPEPNELNLTPPKAWFRRGRFIGSYLVMRLTYLNLNGRTLSLHDVDGKVRPSNRL